MFKQHAIETKTLRSESFAILEALASQISFDDPKRILPHRIVEDDNGSHLYITSQAVLSYLHSKGERFAIGSSKGLIKHLKEDGFLTRADVDMTLGPKGHQKRFKHVLELNLDKIERVGINWPRIVDNF